MKNLIIRFGFLYLFLLFTLNSTGQNKLSDMSNLSGNIIEVPKENFESLTLMKDNQLRIKAVQTPAYCSSTNHKCDSGMSLANLEIKSNGQTVFSENGTCNTTTGHTIVTGDTITMLNGSSYNISFDIPGMWYGEIPELAAAKAWLDFNGNGIFEPEERVMNMPGEYRNSYSSDPFNIPNSTYQGLVRLRIIIKFSSVSEDPCQKDYGSGEARDYIINLGGGVQPPCPDLVTLISPSDNISSGTHTMQANKTTGKINAENKVSGSANVLFEAPAIQMNPGFSVAPGAVFTALPGGCN